jgi:hypothetical protein
MKLSDKLIEHNFNMTTFMYNKYIYLSKSCYIPSVSFDFFLKYNVTIKNILKTSDLPFIDISDSDKITFLEKLNWCEEMFGDAYIWIDSVFYFENEKQLIFYCLRWSQNDTY